jgi:ribosomal protein S12 methylthiotransferase accessory factor
MGKGTTPLQAQAGAVCEALERFSCVYEGDSSAILGRFSELGEAAIDPRSVLLFSERQYDRREATNDPNEHFNLVPERFNPEECIEWTPIRSLLTGETKYLATRQCWFGYPNERGTKFVNPCSNGCASGNNLEEAILQGLMELIERDGVALWWYNSLKRPQIDMSTFDIPHLKHIAERFRQSANRNLWTLDLTADTGIPTVVAISAMTEGETPHLLFGFGASLDPSIAVSRAVTECYQMYSVQEQHLNVDHRTPLGKSLRETTWESCEFVLPDKTVPARTLTDFEFSPTDDTLQDIHTVVDRLHSLGLETFALDMTRPDVEMAVVRVVVPGLRHFWRRLAPGRLYDVPVKMGWLTSPTTEESVNPMQILM